MTDESPHPLEELSLAVARVEARVEDALSELETLQRMLYQHIHGPRVTPLPLGDEV
jgi:chaperonin cofactor prefoldin